MNPKALQYSSWKKKPLIFLYKLFSKNVLFHTSSKQETADTRIIFKGAKTVELPNFIQPEDRLEVTKKNQIAFVGRIHPIKAIHKLIEALALSEKFRNSNFRLVLAGVHELRHQYYMDELLGLIDKHRLGERIEFKGHVLGKEKEKLYAESRFLVLPSETENFGNVVVEALNQGNPVIASKGTPWKILEEYHCGLHVNNSPGDLQLAIDKLISLDEKEYKKMHNASMNLVDKEFNIEKKVDCWRDVYSSLIPNSSEV